MSKITVLGAGGWAIGLAMTALDAGHRVTVWSFSKEEADHLRTVRQSEKLLPGVTVPNEITVTNDIAAVEGSDFTVIAVPSFAVRETAEKLIPYHTGITVCASKGLEQASGKRLSEVVVGILPDRPYVTLSGPTHAEEVARKVPTTIVAASHNEIAALAVQKEFSTAYFRIYTNSDLIGVEYGGAFKNVIAVASGIVDGLGCGDNTKAALITRGISEITRLGVATGAEMSTFLGLAGIGDLVVTCTSVHSRNHRFGKLVGEGMPVDQALKTVGTVEGYFAVEAAIALSDKLGIEMPISRECYEILYHGADCRDALRVLMNRPSRAETEC